jgi:hypothetical protein
LKGEHEGTAIAKLPARQLEDQADDASLLQGRQAQHPSQLPGSQLGQENVALSTNGDGKDGFHGCRP